LRRILHFLGREATDQDVNAAVEAGRPDNMRKIESAEIEKGRSGVFYRPALARGYSRGYRFVGRMHGDSSEKVLTPEARRYARQVFGPLLERICALAGEPAPRLPSGGPIVPPPRLPDAAPAQKSASMPATASTTSEIYCTYFDHNYVSRALV